MAASRPDEARGVIGRGKEKDAAGMSEGASEGGEDAREIEGERSYSIVVRAVRAMAGRRGRDESGTKKDDGSFGIA